MNDATVSDIRKSDSFSVIRSVNRCDHSYLVFDTAKLVVAYFFIMVQIHAEATNGKVSCMILKWFMSILISTAITIEMNAQSIFSDFHPANTIAHNTALKLLNPNITSITGTPSKDPSKPASNEPSKPNTAAAGEQISTPRKNNTPDIVLPWKMTCPKPLKI